MNYHEMSIARKINYRKSGFLLAGIVAVIYTALFIQGKHQPYFAVVAVVLAVLALFEARPLRKTIDLFIGLGNFTHRFTNPLVFGLIFIFAVIPTALVLKLLRKDVLQLRSDSKITSYWKAPNDGKTWKGSFRKQY
jgi:hypothetical protein